MALEDVVVMVAAAAATCPTRTSMRRILVPIRVTLITCVWMITVEVMAVAMATGEGVAASAV